MKNEIIRISVLSEFWERQHKDIIDIVLPIIKCAISSNYIKTGMYKVINCEDVLKCLKQNYNDNFTMLLLKNAMNRLVKYGVLESKDEQYCVRDELVIEEAVKNSNHINEIVEREWKEIVDDLMKFIDRESLIPYINKLHIEDKFWSFLNVVSNSFIDGFENEPTNRILSYYLIQKKNNNDYIYQYIKKIITSIFISKSINLYDISDRDYWKAKRIIVDTRFLMNILDMNCIEENEASKELFDLLSNNTDRIHTFNHNVEEIGCVIDAYNHQKHNCDYINTNIDLFDREHYNPSQISIFRNSLINSINNIGINILDTNSIVIKNKAYIEEFNKNYGEGSNSLTKSYDEKNYIYTLTEYENDKDIVFVSTSSSLFNIYKKCHKGSANIIFISERDLASLYFINNTSNCANYSINKVLSLAYMLQEPSEEFYKSLEEVLNKLKGNGGITEETIMLIAQEHMISKEIAIETGYVGKAITEEKIKKALKKYNDEIKAPLLETINKNQLEFNKSYEENKKVISELNDEISSYKNAMREKDEKIELRNQLYEEVSVKLKQADYKIEKQKKPLDNLDSVINIISIIVTVIILIVMTFGLYMLLRTLYYCTVQFLPKSFIINLLGFIVSLGFLIAVVKIYIKIYIIIHRNIFKWIKGKFYE